MKRRPVAERIDVTLEGLRAVHRRIGLQKLEEGDWQLVGALVLRVEIQSGRPLIALLDSANRRKRSHERNKLRRGGVNA